MINNQTTLQMFTLHIKYQDLAGEARGKLEGPRGTPDSTAFMTTLVSGLHKCQIS